MEARELFHSIATDAPDNAPALTELIREMDGLALAVELLARDADGVELQSVLERWKEERVAMLDGGSPENPRFASSIELALSSPRMTPDASRLLSVLALFPAGVAREDRGALMPGSAAALAHLQKVALVYGEADRWRIRAPIREYILKTRPPSAEDRARAFGVYMELARTLGPRVGRLEGRDALSRLGAELGNIEVALLEEMHGADARGAIETMLCMNTLVRFSGLEPTLAMERALAWAEREGDENLRAQCLFTKGRILQRQSRYEESLAAAEEALRLFERTGDPSGRSKALHEVGSVSVNLERVEKAEESFLHALSLRKQLQDERGMGYSLHGLGRVARLQGNTEASLQCFEEALRLLTKNDDPLGRAHCLRHLGELREEAGPIEEARALFERIGDHRNQGNCLLGLARLARKQGRLAEATSHCEDALRFFQQVHSAQKEDLCRRELEELRG